MTINKLDAAADSADQKLGLDPTARGTSVELRTSPTGTPDVERSVETRGRPPSVRVGRY